MHVPAAACGSRTRPALPLRGGWAPRAKKKNEPSSLNYRQIHIFKIFARVQQGESTHLDPNRAPEAGGHYPAEREGETARERMVRVRPPLYPMGPRGWGKVGVVCIDYTRILRLEINAVCESSA